MYLVVRLHEATRKLTQAASIHAASSAAVAAAATQWAAVNATQPVPCAAHASTSAVCGAAAREVAAYA